MENIPKIKGYELLSKKVCKIVKSKIINGSFKPRTKLLEVKLSE